MYAWISIRRGLNSLFLFPNTFQNSVNEQMMNEKTNKITKKLDENTSDRRQISFMQSGRGGGVGRMGVKIIWCFRWFSNPPPLIWGSVLLYMRSPKGGCCPLYDDLSCSYVQFMCNFSVDFPIPASQAICKLTMIWNSIRGTLCHQTIAIITLCHRNRNIVMARCYDVTMAMLRCYDGTMLRWR